MHSRTLEIRPPLRYAKGDVANVEEAVEELSELLKGEGEGTGRPDSLKLCDRLGGEYGDGG